ncbi:MAG: tail fiber domain-containing protein [Ferruginibacter sp.]
MAKFILLVSFLSIAGISFAQIYPDNVIKKNISEIDNAMEAIIRLKPKVFEYDTHSYKHLYLKKGTHYGFIAENFKDVFPGLVREKRIPYMYGKNVYRDAIVKTIDEASLIPFLVAAFKEQQIEIEKLKIEIQRLKAR